MVCTIDSPQGLKRVDTPATIDATTTMGRNGTLSI
jgi:hypothetical protein